MYLQTFYRSVKQKQSASEFFLASSLYLTVSVSLQKMVSSSAGSISRMKAKLKAFLQDWKSALLQDLRSIQVVKLLQYGVRNKQQFWQCGVPYNYKYIMSSYQMKKSLRRPAGGPRSYAEIDEEAEHNENEDKKDRDLKEIVRESIFEHKNWSVKQKVKLMVFFAYYISLPDWNSERRSIHLYKHLSNFMKKTRTPEQCKNIHSLLKRKFIRLEDVVEAMRIQLEGEENYQKLLSKYEKDIEIYELENKLKDDRFDQQKYESLKSRRVTEKDQKRQPGGQIFMREDVRQYKTQKDNSLCENKISFNSYVKREEAPRSAFETQRERLVKQSNFYFRQWLKYTLIYNQRQASSKSE